VDADYVIVGEGPARKQLKELAATLGLVDRVSLLGRVPRAEVFELLSRSSVLLHPSLHDSGGAVCLEAMAAGAPVVCLDVGGPGEVVRSDCGVAVAALSPSQVVDDLAEALQRLLGDPQMRAAMGSRARARVGAIFREDRRVERQLATYASVLSKQPFGSGGGEAESVPVMRPILRPGEGRSGQ
jgi:glycosyltransferase involved in cell wall biosynthesis